MDTIKHEIVDDRIIYGNGTDKQSWLDWKNLSELPKLDISQWVSQYKRVVIVAPHPDDEILGCAGLLQQLATFNIEVLLLAVTNGTQSHPQSSRYSAQDLNHIRPQESLAALNVLGLGNRVQRIALNLEDGQVHAQQKLLYKALTTQISNEDLLICTYAKDGHPDHETTGHVVQSFADQQGLPCYQVLIWAWHWASPNDPRINWQQAWQLILTPAQLALKRQAIACFKSQTEADRSIGQPPILSASTIERILQPREVYLYAG
ncbi:MAG: PIG-L family deacetylase [Acinetobacter populi]|jgi:LmbE family N-acetylglucosaminyl deacetylase|uniref:PIG-L deacetylase family protein n=1 Tax=Acinetobacter populi TaxID=1582270 RepID=UPI0023543EC3|nr:PIG-L deacetylase family protein [Acinetobacter populi]MCH4246217.1 PIG-L family deacetylase [Acinetobacter populi]